MLEIARSEGSPGKPVAQIVSRSFSGSQSLHRFCGMSPGTVDVEFCSMGACFAYRFGDSPESHSLGWQEVGIHTHLGPLATKVRDDAQTVVIVPSRGSSTNAKDQLCNHSFLHS